MDSKADSAVSAERAFQAIGLEVAPCDNNVCRQTLLQPWRSNPLYMLQGSNPTRQRSTPDPTLLHQLTVVAEEAMKEEVIHNVSLKFGKMRNQLINAQSNKQFVAYSWAIACGQCYTSAGWRTTLYLEKTRGTQGSDHHRTFAGTIEWIWKRWLSCIWMEFGTWMVWREFDNDFTN